MNATTQNIIEKHINEIDNDLPRFLYDMSLTISEGDMDDLLYVLRESDIDVKTAQYEALNMYLKHAAYWWKKNREGKTTVLDWIQTSFFCSLGLTDGEMVEYAISHRDNYKEWVIITPGDNYNASSIQVRKC